MVALFELFSVCLRPGRINSDSLAAQISTALVKRVKRHDCLTADIGYIIHVEFWEVRAMYILMSLSHGSPNLQLGSAAFHIYLNLSAILVPSGRFSCRSQVSYHIFVFLLHYKNKGHKVGQAKATLSIVSRRARRPFS